MTGIPASHCPIPGRTKGSDCHRCSTPSVRPWSPASMPTRPRRSRSASPARRACGAASRLPTRLVNAPPLEALNRSDDPHGIADSFLYGVSLNRIARPGERGRQRVPDAQRHRTGRARSGVCQRSLASTGGGIPSGGRAARSWWRCRARPGSPSCADTSARCCRWVTRASRCPRRAHPRPAAAAGTVTAAGAASREGRACARSGGGNQRRSSPQRDRRRRGAGRRRGRHRRVLAADRHAAARTGGRAGSPAAAGDTTAMLVKPTPMDTATAVDSALRDSAAIRRRQPAGARPADSMARIGSRGPPPIANPADSAIGVPLRDFLHVRPTRAVRRWSDERLKRSRRWP